MIVNPLFPAIKSDATRRAARGSLHALAAFCGCQWRRDTLFGSVDDADCKLSNSPLSPLPVGFVKKHRAGVADVERVRVAVHQDGGHRVAGARHRPNRRSGQTPARVRFLHVNHCQLASWPV